MERYIYVDDTNFSSYIYEVMKMKKMTIEEILFCLRSDVLADCEDCTYRKHAHGRGCREEAIDGAKNIIKKYREIEKIWANFNEGEYTYALFLRALREVLEDGND